MNRTRLYNVVNPGPWRHLLAGDVLALDGDPMIQPTIAIRDANGRRCVVSTAPIRRGVVVLSELCDDQVFI